MFQSEIDRQKTAALWDFGGVDYMNHGSFGACPLSLRAFQAAERERFLQSPVDYFTGPFAGKLLAARQFWARFTHADADGVVMMEGATQGVNTVMKSLALRGWFRPDDEILITSHGYNACNNVAREIAAMTGARVTIAKVPFPIEDAAQVTAGIMAAVTDKTRLAIIDHITSETALIFPIADIVAALKQKGVETLVDGAHAPAHVQIDLTALAPAFYTGNGHKWLCAAPGCAFLYVAPAFRDMIRPLNTSHGANDPNPDISAFLKAFNWPGTRDCTAWFTAAVAHDTLASLHPQGLQALMADNRRLALYGYRLLLDAAGQKPHAPENMLGLMASVIIPAGDAPRLRYDMRQRDNFVTQLLRMSPEIGTARIFRVAAHAYNTPQQMERLAKALPEALAREKRGETLQMPAAG